MLWKTADEHSKTGVCLLGVTNHAFLFLQHLISEARGTTDGTRTVAVFSV